MCKKLLKIAVPLLLLAITAALTIGADSECILDRFFPPP
jgi:hypothetical protein